MSFQSKVNNDLEWEAKSINGIQSYLEGLFETPLERTPHFHKFDFKSSDNSLFFEVKSRRNRMNSYPTTMIPQGKINWALAHILPKGGRAFFVFHFLDCLCLIEYTQEKFKSFEVKRGGRFDRGGPEVNQYCFIPVSSLEPQLGYTSSEPLPASSCH